MKSSAAFDKNTVEFVTVAAEYCAYLEQIFDKEPERVVDVLCKLLPLVYLKATMLPEAEPEGLYLEECVTEADYEDIRTQLAQKLGENDDYLEVFVEDMKYSDTPVRKCISEDLADIHQALRNFVQSYRSGLDEVMTEAVAVCAEGFRTYWGQTLANTLRAVHNVRFNSDLEIDNSFMIELPNKIEKSYLADKPRVVFDGIIEEIDTEEKAQKAIEALSKESVVGFDTETRPSFTRGVAHKIALLQLSTDKYGYLFRLNKMGIPDCVAEFLSNPDIIKVGISIKDDFHSMSSRRKFTPAGFVELQELCGEMGIEEKGLQKLYCLLFNERISKNQQLSNWEIDSLTESQRQYAAIDAWACLRIYYYISELKRTGDYRIIRKDAEECNTEER